MSRKTHKFLVFFITTLLGVGVLNLLTTSAYRGINPYVCKEVAGMFAQSPSLLMYEDFDRLGDCVKYYKTIYSVLKRSPGVESEVSKAKRFESPGKNYLNKSLDFYSR